MKNRKRLVSILAGVMAAVMLLSLILSLIPVSARAYESSSEIRAQINALKKEKEAIQAQIMEVKEQYKANEDEIADIVAQKNVIDQEIGLLSTELININEQISAYNVLIADKQDELDHAQERYDTLNENTKDRIRAMEEDGSLSYWEVLFKANSFSDLLDRMNMVEEIAASDQKRLKALGEAAERVVEAQEELELEKADLQLTKDELDATQAELDAKRQEADQLIQDLLAKGHELEELEALFEEQKRAFLEEIAQQEEAYSEAKHREYLAWLATSETTQPPTTAPSNNNSGGSNGGTTNNSKPSNSGTVNTGSGWQVPCSYTKLTSPFGNREQPTAGASTYHQGVDLAAPEGTPVYASRGGQVTTATVGSAAGYYVKINHMDGFSSIYMHLRNYVVSAGQYVSQGQLIGYVGKSGVATGFHLHFGILYNGAYVNPASYVALY
ncbi:MAG: peptidoglycan DD-metalloendopeptidase family protein [Oscillospiraceae bacterium]|nr:peptidoglycan DD-metalloendopeptidase family protein [Oscillospiraceae bacterium]MBQ7129702.1 peptidoglycan DD-metalloendopeptidase family protein [Oscillospiraceae bacterium]